MRQSEGLRLFLFRAQFGVGAKAGVGLLRPQQAFYVAVISAQAFRLAVRRIGTTGEYAFVFGNAEPLHGIENQNFAFGAGAFLVGVFDAHDKLPARRLRV